MFVYFVYYVYVCFYVGSCHCPCVDIKGQLVGVGFLFSTTRDPRAELQTSCTCTHTHAHEHTPKHAHTQKVLNLID